jgi:Na+/H+ antiporter NhaD/arsenite permease-like protein
VHLLYDLLLIGKVLAYAAAAADWLKYKSGIGRLILSEGPSRNSTVDQCQRSAVTAPVRIDRVHARHRAAPQPLLPGGWLPPLLAAAAAAGVASRQPPAGSSGRWLSPEPQVRHEAMPRPPTQEPLLLEPEEAVGPEEAGGCCSLCRRREREEEEQDAQAAGCCNPTNTSRRVCGRVTEAVGGVLIAALVLVACVHPPRNWVGAQPPRDTLCQNRLDIHKNHSCLKLIEGRGFSCDDDFCETCGPMAGMCDRTCGECTSLLPAGGLRVCASQIGQTEALVHIVFLFAWVNLMVPGLLPLARCTTSMMGAALTTAVRKLGHDVLGPSQDYNDEYIDMDSYAQIELPVISLLAGLMVLAGFMEHMGFFDSLAHFIQHPFYLCKLCRRRGCCRQRGCGVGGIQVAKNMLVCLIVIAMTSFFLLGPLLQVDVGAIAFCIALVCLVGLGIYSARELKRAAVALERRRLQQESDYNESLKYLLTGYRSPQIPAGDASSSPAATAHDGTQTLRRQVTTLMIQNIGNRVRSAMGQSFRSTMGVLAIQDTETADQPLGQRGTLVMLCLVSGGLSALIMNDTVALVFAPMIVSKLRGGHERFPYLMALAAASDVGSALTNVGNPQNSLIAASAQLDFSVFVKFMTLPVCASMAILIMMLWCCPWKKHEDTKRGSVAADGTQEMDCTMNQRDQAANDRIVLDASDSPRSSRTTHFIRSSEPEAEPEPDLEVGLQGGVKPEATVDNGQLEDEFTPEFLKEHIDIPLLLLFAGQFIMVQGLVDTGVPKCVWENTMPAEPLGSPSKCCVFVFAIVVLSNLISNVPLILLMRPMLSHFRDDEAKRIWLVVAFASTMAGNLILIGSASNLIVACVLCF